MIKLIAVIGITLMIVEFALPIQWIKVHFKLDQGSPNPKQLFKRLFKDAINCCFCLGFWIGLLFYFDLYMAVIISFSSEIAYRLYSKFNNLI